MGYIGKELTKGAFKLITLGASFNGSTTAFTMSEAAGNANNLLVILGGVLQHWGEAYTVSGTTITFSSAPAASTTIKILKLGDTYDMGQAGSLKPEAVSGLTNITTLADADEFLVHDATDNQLKAVVKSSMPAGAWTFLESDSQISSFVSSVEFQLSDRTDYDVFRIMFYALEQNTNDNYIGLQFKVGGSYATSSYYGGTSGDYSGSSNGTATNTATDSVRLVYGIKNDQDYPNNGFIDIYNPHNTDSYKSAGGMFFGPTATGSNAMTRGTIGGYYYGSTGAITHVKFIGQSSSTFKGKFFFYGLKTS